MGEGEGDEDDMRKMRMLTLLLGSQLSHFLLLLRMHIRKLWNFSSRHQGQSQSQRFMRYCRHSGYHAKQIFSFFMENPNHVQSSCIIIAGSIGTQIT
jgi:hypothetical protein